MRILVAFVLALALAGSARGQTCFAGASGGIHCISTGVHIGPQNYFSLIDALPGPFNSDRLLSIGAVRGFIDLPDGVRDEFSEGVSFFFDGKTLSGTYSPDLGYGIDLYFVERGQPFTKETIDNGLFQPIYRATRQPYISHIPVDIPGSDSFYLGVNTGFMSVDANGQIIRDTFGWALVENHSGRLFLRNYAMAYQSRGIIIGTTQTVPEPATAIMLIAAVAALAPLRKGTR